MPTEPGCPEIAVLQELALGRLPKDEAARIEAHLAQCPRCAEAVNNARTELTAKPTAGERTSTEHTAPSESQIASVTGPLSVSGSRTGSLSVDGGTAQLTDAEGEVGERSFTAESLEIGQPSTVTSPLPEFSGRKTADEVFDFLHPAQTPDEMGRLGGFRVLRVLGSGGMGVVFEAEDPQLKRQVALKAMRPSMAISTRARERFVREARATAKLTHDHIVRIHKVDDDRGVLFLAMQLLKGETLRDRLKREPVLPVPEICRIGKEIADGLAAAHDQGLIHRDVKPGNIWLEAGKGRVKILDFGLARALDNDSKISHSGMVAGTPQYMAPEQAEGLNVDARADLFSLGCVLYRMATGRVPFQGPNLMAILRALALEEAKDPCELNPALPPELSELIMKLLAKTAADRPASAHAVCRELTAIENKSLGKLSPIRLSAAGESARGTARLPGRSKKGLWIVAAALLVAALAGGIVFFLTRPPAGTQATLEFTSVDDLVIVQVRGGDRTYTLVDLKKDNRLELPPGEYEIRLLDASPGLETESARITLADGERKQVAVRRTEGARIAADALHRMLIPPARLVWAGDGDPGAAPAQLVAILGSGSSGDAEQLWKISGRARALAISPDGKQILANLDGRAYLVNPDKGKKANNAISNKDVGGRPAFTPTGRILGFTNSKSGFKVRDVKTDELVQELKGHTDDVVTAALSPDGKLVATGAKDKTAKIWNLQTGNVIWTLDHDEAVYNVAFGANGKLFATGAGKTVRVWNLDSGKEEHKLTGHDNAVTGLAFSDDSAYLASGGRDMSVRVWHLAKEKTVAQRKVAVGTAVAGLQFSADGRRLLSVGRNFTKEKTYEGGIVELWDWQDGQVIALPGAGRNGYSRADFLSGGKRVLTSSEVALALWALPPPGQRLAVDGHQGPVQAVAVNRDGILLASAGQDKLVRLWDVARGELRRSLPGHADPVGAVAFSPDGDLLASADADVIRLWNVDNFKEVHVFKAPVKGDHAAALAFSREGQYLAAGYANGEVHVFHLSTRQLSGTLSGHTGAVRALAFGRGLVLASAAADGVRVWQPVTGDLVHHFKGFDKAVTALAFSRDGRVLAGGGEDRTLRLWDVAAGKLQAALAGHTAPIHGLAFRHDGQVLASAGGDGSVRLWDLGLDPPEDNPLRLFSADSRIWPQGRPIRGVAFTPDGQFLATANDDGTIYILALASPRLLADAPAPATLPLLRGEAGALQQLWAQSLKRPVVDTNSLGMKLALIPPGDFTMANNYQVKLSRPYYLGSHEVTFAQFREFVEATGYKTDAESSGEGAREFHEGQWKQHPDNTWRTLAKARGDNHPVGNISWNDAVRFCAWLSRKEKTTYRLATETEWEWACRAGSNATHHFGSSSTRMAEFAWFAGNAEGVTHPVGTLKPNAWGLYDVYGNVREFCDSAFADPAAPAKTKQIALRGGGFIDSNLSSLTRFTAPPGAAASIHGFRVLREIHGAESFHVDGVITEKDPFDTERDGCHRKVHQIELIAGKAVTIDLMSKDFDAYLRLEDAKGKTLDEDDDSGEGRNARLHFLPETTGMYRLIATTYSRGDTGRYTLTVRERVLVPGSNQ